MIPIAGGVASFAEAGSPYNKVAGVGFGCVPGLATWEEIERAYAALGAPAQVELAHLADPAIGAVLTGRGYRLILFARKESVRRARRAGNHRKQVVEWPQVMTDTVRLPSSAT